MDYNKGLVLSGVKSFIAETGDMAYFAGRFFREVFKRPFEFKEFLRQCYNIGNRSFLLVGITGFIIGLVFTLQSRPRMVELGADAWIPSMVALAIIREIGPLFTALISAGRIGSAIGAELGSMRVTEQIDAMEVSGTNPFKYLVVTRIMACTLMIPILVILSNFLALYGSFLVEQLKGEVSFRYYFDEVFRSITYSDLLPSTIKTFFFGFAIGLVGCYNGYYCKHGTAGVGIAANTAVVKTSLMLFVIDFVAALITDILFLS